jgi:hypothetical protein
MRAASDDDALLTEAVENGNGADLWAVIAICTAMMIAEISRWSLVWIGCVSRRTCLV